MFIVNKRPFEVSLRPDVSCLQLLADARFDRLHEAVEIGLGGPKLEGRRRAKPKSVAVHLVGFNRRKDNHLIVAACLAEDGFRSANIREVLAFAGQFPDEQRIRWIASAETQWSGEWGHSYVPLLLEDQGGGRALTLWCGGNGFAADVRFLAVREG